MCCEADLLKRWRRVQDVFGSRPGRSDFLLFLIFISICVFSSFSSSSIQSVLDRFQPSWRPSSHPRPLPAALHDESQHLSRFGPQLINLRGSRASRPHPLTTSPPRVSSETRSFVGNGENGASDGPAASAETLAFVAVSAEASSARR